VLVLVLLLDDVRVPSRPLASADRVVTTRWRLSNEVGLWQ